MRTLQQWLDEYGESHKNETNKTIHWICVPTIFFSVTGFALLRKTTMGNCRPAKIEYSHDSVTAGSFLLFFPLQNFMDRHGIVWLAVFVDMPCGRKSEFYTIVVILFNNVYPCMDWPVLRP